MVAHTKLRATKNAHSLGVVNFKSNKPTPGDNEQSGSVELFKATMKE